MSNTCEVCQNAAYKRCSGCQLVWYCSVAHQKEHWKEHKVTCRTFAIQKNEKYGRYVIAARDIEPGTIIMNEPSIMIGPRQNTLPLCLGCNKTLTGPAASRVYYCTKCSFPMCGPACEKIPIHSENECAVFSKYKLPSKVTSLTESHPSYESILTLRCLLLKTKQPKKWEQLVAMQHHNELRKELPMLWYRNETYTLKVLREHCKMKEFEEMDIHSVIGYADINSFEIKTKDVSVSGLFNNTYLMSHDCLSNTHHTFTDDFRMVVRASVPIKKGTLITTSYTNTMDGTLLRREFLKESKFFDCDCPRCADPTEFGTYFSAIKCSKCETGYLLPRNPLYETSNWNCNACSGILTVDVIHELANKIQNEIEIVECRNPQYIIKDMECILKKYSGTVLHPNHYLLMNLTHSLTQLYGRVNSIDRLELADLKRKESHCENLLKVIDVIEPGMSRIRGVTLYELQGAIFYSARAEFQSNAYTPTEMKKKLEKVRELLSKSVQILSFDSPSSPEGRLAISGPANMQGVLDVMARFCAGV